MLTLLAGTGSKTYELRGAARLSESEARGLKRAARLLRAEGNDPAASLLERYRFEFAEATNDFGDEFDVLHAEVSLSEYVDLKKRVGDRDFQMQLRTVQDALHEVGFLPRFIICSFRDHDSESRDEEEIDDVSHDESRGDGETGHGELKFKPAPPIDIDPTVAELDESKIEAEARLFEAMLDANANEHELHAFLAARSYFFNGIIRLFGASPLYSKIKLGADFEVDFACFDSGSSGPEWRLVELERVRPIFTKAGDPSAALTHAMRQVLDWQAWLHENLSYARKLMPHIEYPLGYVFIGRRADLTASSVQRLRRMQHEHRRVLEIHTLDWFVDTARGVAPLLKGGGRWPLPSHALTHASLARGLPLAASKYMSSFFERRTQEQFVEEMLDERELRARARDMREQEE